ncbi:C6 zinc finger domain-containing protein [Colletotrichum asianum]
MRCSDLDRMASVGIALDPRPQLCSTLKVVRYIGRLRLAAKMKHFKFSCRVRTFHPQPIRLEIGYLLLTTHLSLPEISLTDGSYVWPEIESLNPIMA